MWRGLFKLTWLEIKIFMREPLGALGTILVPVAVFKGHTVTEIKFYPVDMGFRVPRPHQGTPRLAEPALAQKIVERFAKMSEVYGTTITFENGIGIWRSAPR